MMSARPICSMIHRMAIHRSEADRRRSRRSVALSLVAGVLLAALLVGAVPAHAGRSPQDYLAMVRSIWRRSSTPPPAGRAYHFVYTVTTRPRDPKEKPVVMKVDLTAGDRGMRFLSDRISVYQDATASYTLVPQEKKIYVTGVSSPGMAGARDRRMSQVMSLNDTLLSMYESVTAAERGGAETVVTMVMNGRAQRRFQVRRITVTVDTRRQFITRALIDYTAERAVASVETAFTTIDLDHSPEALATPAGAQFLAAEGGLQPKYRGYRLVDTRSIRSNH